MPIISYYLGRPADVWMAAMSRPHMAPESRHGGDPAASFDPGLARVSPDLQLRAEAGAWPCDSTSAQRPGLAHPATGTALIRGTRG